MAAARDEQLLALVTFVKSQNDPIVLIGDLNTTSYSPAFRDLCESTGLRDSRQGFGIQASWTPRLPVLEIAIDHCLVPAQSHVAERRRWPSSGVRPSTCHCRAHVVCRCSIRAARGGSQLHGRSAYPSPVSIPSCRILR